MHPENPTLLFSGPARSDERLLDGFQSCQGECLSQGSRTVPFLESPVRQLPSLKEKRMSLLLYPLYLIYSLSNIYSRFCQNLFIRPLHIWSCYIYSIWLAVES